MAATIWVSGTSAASSTIVTVGPTLLNDSLYLAAQVVVIAMTVVLDIIASSNSLLALVYSSNISMYRFSLFCSCSC
jgi:hypothetical protein